MGGTSKSSKSSIFVGLSMISQPFWGTPMTMETSISDGLSTAIFVYRRMCLPALLVVDSPDPSGDTLDPSGSEDFETDCSEAALAVGVGYT